MLEKLFARLRSRQKGDLAAPAAGLPLTPPTKAAGKAAGTSAGAATVAATLPTLAGPLTPPPLPADAWAEQESGIVITDSGIIILEAEPPQASKPATAPTPARGSSLPPAPPSAPTPRAPGELDWDDVLARARARAEEAQPVPRPNRAKAK
jgi:hypothetical protein